MASGQYIVDYATKKIGQEYVFGASVPLDNSAWAGPWDCAELCSWAVYQASSVVYGCTNNKDAPAVANPWTSSWKRDAESIGIRIDWKDAATIPGAMLLRRTNNAGHIAVSTGSGNRTVEARGRKFGVVNHKVSGRGWHMGVLIKGINYAPPKISDLSEADNLVGISAHIDALQFSGDGIVEVQAKLSSIGLMEQNPGSVFNSKTEIALLEFQKTVGLTPHGMLDDETLNELGIDRNLLGWQ